MAEVTVTIKEVPVDLDRSLQYVADIVEALKDANVRDGSVACLLAFLITSSPRALDGDQLLDLVKDVSSYAAQRIGHTLMGTAEAPNAEMTKN